MLLINRILDRRAALLLALASTGIHVGAGGIAVAAAPSRTKEPRDVAGGDPLARLADKGQAFTTLMRMMASTVPEDCTWFYRGRLYAQVGDSVPKALCGLIGAETYWPVPQADGNFVLSASTFSYPTPLDSEEPLPRFENPYTGATDVPTPNLYRNDASTLLTPDGMVHVPGSAPDGHNMQFTRIGDWLQMQHEAGQSQIPQPHREIGILSSPMAEFQDPTVHRLSTLSTVTFVSRWPKWMKMEARPGHVLWSVGSKKVKSPDEMPRPYLSRLMREHPALISARPGTPGRTDVVY